MVFIAIVLAGLAAPSKSATTRRFTTLSMTSRDGFRSSTIPAATRGRSPDEVLHALGRRCRR